jgi:hypothetical protein
MANNQNNAENNGARGSKGQRTRNQRQQKQNEKFTDCFREYMALSKVFHAAMSFKDFRTIIHPEWYEPQISMDKEEDGTDTVLLQQRDSVVWDEKPINGTVICDEGEAKVVDGMGDISRPKDKADVIYCSNNI